MFKRTKARIEKFIRKNPKSSILWVMVLAVVLTIVLFPKNDVETKPSISELAASTPAEPTVSNVTFIVQKRIGPNAPKGCVKNQDCSAFIYAESGKNYMVNISDDRKNYLAIYNTFKVGHKYTCSIRQDLLRSSDGIIVSCNK